VNIENITTDAERDEVSGSGRQDETVETFSQVHLVLQESDNPSFLTQVQSVSNQPATRDEQNFGSDSCGASETLNCDVLRSAELHTNSHMPVAQGATRSADGETAQMVASKSQESSSLIGEGLSTVDVISSLPNLCTEMGIS